MGFLKHSTVGITITDTFIEVAALAEEGGNVSVSGATRVTLAPLVVENGLIKDAQVLKDALQGALADAQPQPLAPDKAIVVLPAQHTFVMRVPVPSDVRAEHEAVIAQEMQKSIPLAPDDVFFAYAPLDSSTQESDTLLFVAADKDVMSAWHDFFESLSIKAEFDAEPLAVYRALAIPEGSGTVCLADATDAILNVALFEGADLSYYYGRPLAEGEDPVQELHAEVLDALSAVTQSDDTIGDTLILASAGEETDTLVSHLQKKIRTSVASADTRIQSAYPLRLGTLGAALRTLDTQWDDSHPLLAVKNARTLEAREDSDTETNEEEDIDAIIKAKRATARLKKQKVALGILVLVGVTALIGAYFWRAGEKEELTTERETTTTQFTQTQTLTLDVPVATKKDDYTEENVPGRVHTVTIESSGSYREAVANAKREAQKELTEHERVWDTPVNEPADTENVTFPLEISWLIYSKAHADELFIAKVQERNTENTAYALGVITVTGAVQQDGSAGAFYTLTADVSLSLNEPFPTDATAAQPAQEEAPAEDVQIQESEASAEETKKTALILDTPTGWLNVRSGPGTENEQIDRITPGDSYPLLETSGEWHNIELSGGKNGWVFGEYVEIK